MKLPFRFLFSLVATIACAAFSHAADVVVYSPLTTTLEGNEPYNYSHALVVTPPKLPLGTYTITVSVTNAPPGVNTPILPTGVSASTALSFVSITGTGVTAVSPGVYQVTFNYDPNANTDGSTTATQALFLTFNESVPLGNYAGNYGYYVTTSGWPATDNLGDPVSDGYATYNETVSPPQPTITISGPTNGEIFTIPTGQTSYQVPYSIQGTTPTGTTMTLASATLYTGSGTTGAVISGFSPTFYGLGTTSVTTNIGTSGTNATYALGPGTYTLSATDTNNFGGVGTTNSATQVTFTVVGSAPPTISITSPTNGQVFSANAGTGTASVPYNIMGTTAMGLLSAGTASMLENGTTPVVTFAGVFSGLGSASISDMGTINLAPGSYTINASDTSVSVLGGPILGSATATPVTFTVVAGPTISITGPTSGQVFEATSSGMASVPYTISGSTPAGTTFPSATSATATLTSSTGASVTAFAPVFTVGTGSTAISTSGAVSLAPGTYTIYAADTNNSGGSANATPVTFTVVGPPTISITGPMSGQVFEITSSGTAAVPFAISGSTPTGTTFTSATSATATLTSSTGASTSAFAATFTVGSGSTTISSTGSVNLAPGTYTLNATDTNNLGGTGTATPVTFTVVGLPTISITSPGNGAVFSAGTAGTASVTYTITGSTPTGTTLSTATGALADNGTPVTTFIPTFSGVPGSASTTATGTLSLAPGTYTLNASETNNLGAAAAATQITFTVIAAPTISITGPTNNQVFSVSATTGTAAVPYTITASTPSGSTLSTATATLTTGGTAVSGFTPTFSGVPGAATSTATGTVNVGPGSYIIAAADTNNDGGSASATQVVFTVVGPPTIAISAPTSGQVIYIPTGSTTASVSYTINGSTLSGTTFPTASSGAAALSLASGSTGSLTGVVQPTFTGYGSTSTSITSTGTWALTAGTYTLNASDNNNVGGTATATPVTFTVQAATVPTITISAPTNGQVVYIPSGSTTAAVSYTITGSTPSGSTFPSASSGSAVLAVASGSTGSVSGVAQPTFTGYGASSTAITSTAIVNLPAGTYTLSATDTNNLGGSASAGPVTFTVAPSVTPAITISAPTNGASITIPSGSTTAAVTYTITGTTPSGSTFTSASAATATLTSSTGSSTGSFAPTFVLSSSSTGISTTGTVNLPAGTYTINATDTNNTGASATATPVTFTVVGGTCSAPTVTTTGSFCGNSSCKGGNTIWFNSTVNVTGMSSAGGVLEFNNSTISFAVNGSTVNLVAPAAVITFSPTATTATSAYSAASNTWNTTVPAGYTGNVFLTGLSYSAPANFNPGTETVTWSGAFLGSVQNLSVQWLWSANVLTQCGSDYNACGIKPVDSGSICQFNNGDCAGTCENYKSYNCGSACASSGTSSNTTKVSISGLYTTGVTNTGALLTPGSSDPHYVITGDTAPNPNNYLGNSYVDLSPLAGGWVSNTASAQWVTAPGGTTGGNGAGNCNLPSSGGGGYNVFYFYTLTFAMPANAITSTATITGTLAADDAVETIVNWSEVGSGVGQPSSASYCTTSNFTFNSSNSSFVAGSNTITFAVFNLNPGPDPSGLLVTALSGTVQVPSNVESVTYCPGLGGSSAQSVGSPPTVTATNPTNNATYTVASGSCVTVPVGFTAISPANSGNITAIAATLNGSPVTLTTTTGVNSSATATGGASLSLSSAGTYTLVYTGTNAYGSATASVSFTVVVVQPPTLTVTAPANGSTITIPYGSCSVSVPYTVTGSTSASVITSIGLLLNGSNITPTTTTGLNTANVTLTGTLTLSAGTYSLGGADYNGYAYGSGLISFTVVQGTCGGGYVGSCGSNNEYLVWLQQSCNNGWYGTNSHGNGDCDHTVTGGSIVPIAFSVYSSSCYGNNTWGSACSNNFVTDGSVVIAVYEIYSNNTCSAPTLFTYGANGPNIPYFEIGNNEYLLEFPTPAGTHHYQVEVYSGGNSLCQLGCQDIYTSGSCMPSTTSNSCGFNWTPISAGRCIWFNSVCNVSGLSSHATTLWFDSSTINFTCGGVAQTVNCPAACIKFNPYISTASTTFDSADNCWVTVVPSNYSGNVFLTGACYTVPSNLPSGLNPVSWTGCFRSDTGSVNAQWQCSAAVYTQCPSSLSSVNVKPCDSSWICPGYQNNDCAGTPENLKGCLTSGACGYGGSNYTGSFGNSCWSSISNCCWLDSNVWTGSVWNWGW